MRKLLIFISVLFSFIVIGCDKEKARVEFSTDNIVMEYGSTYLIDYDVYGDVKNIKFTIENENIVSIEGKVLTAHQPGETTLICTYNKDGVVEINVKVLYEGQEILDIGDPNENEKNYNNLKNEIDTFSQALEKSKYLSINIELSLNDEKISQKLKASQSPIYIEISDDNNIEVIAQEGDSLFHYLKNSSEICERKYIGSASDFNDYGEIDNSGELLETTFNKEKVNVTYQDDTYIIKCYYKDALNEESKNLIEELYSDLGVPIDILYDSIITMKYVVYEEKIYMSLSLTLNGEMLINPISITVKFELDLKQFTPKDMLNSGYIFSKPSCFEEVVGLYNFDKSIEVSNSEPTYMKISVERGMIASTSNDIGFELYDMNKNLVSESLGGANSGFIPFISVPENGTYYLVAKNKSGTSKNVKLEFHKYETVVGKDGIDLSSGKTFNGTIEGKYDFEKYIFNNTTTKNSHLRIENTGKNDIYFINYKNNKSVEIEKIEPSKAKSIPISTGENVIYICESYLDRLNNNGYEYSFNYDILQLDFYGNIFESTIPSSYFISSGEKIYYHTYLEEGMYRVNSEKFTEDIEILVYDNNGKKLDVNVAEYGGNLDRLSSYFTINKSGKYYVAIFNHSSAMNITFKKFEYETIMDKENPIILNLGDTYNGHLEGIHDFEYYRVKSNIEGVKVYCITNESDVSFKVIVKKYLKDSIKEHNVSPGRKFYFTSYSMNTEFMILQNYNSTEDKTLDFKFNIVELVNHNITDINSPDIKEITQEYSEEYYMVGFCLPEAVFILNIEERGIIEFEYENYEEHMYLCFSALIKSEDGNIFEPGEILEPGKYYVYFASNDHLFGYAKIRYSLVVE